MELDDTIPDTAAPALCTLCEGRGMRIVESENGDRVAQTCSCQADLRLQRALDRAGIPIRYSKCTLQNYRWGYSGANPSLREAMGAMWKYVNGYPLEVQGTGMLITGSIGVGKTHLAVGLLKALITERGVHGLFCHYGTLLRDVQRSYNPNVAAEESEILAPVFRAEVLVLDELGAVRPTDWVSDTVAHILNTRYQDQRTTILTTNYPNLAPMGSGGHETPAQQARTAMREETLGDRIGERMRSRLQEMCAIVEVSGEDYRQKMKRPSLT